MTRHHPGPRIIALFCAYALVLHAFLSAATLTAHAAAVTSGPLCNSQAEGTSPAAPVPTSCVLHCLVPGLGCSGTSLDATAAAIVAPVAGVVLPPRSFVVLGRTPQRKAQLPRAPPSA
jgi:hypothetical protein